MRFERGGIETLKFFSDIAYHGKRRARLAAIEWRDATIKELPPSMGGRGHQGEVKPPGYFYVKRMTVSACSGKRKFMYDAFVAFLRIEDRKHLSTRWSIDKWGKAVARSRCEAWVERKTQELEARLRAARSEERGRGGGVGRRQAKKGRQQR